MSNKINEEKICITNFHEIKTDFLNALKTKPTKNQVFLASFLTMCIYAFVFSTDFVQSEFSKIAKNMMEMGCENPIFGALAGPFLMPLWWYLLSCLIAVSSLIFATTLNLNLDGKNDE